MRKIIASLLVIVMLIPIANVSAATSGNHGINNVLGLGTTKIANVTYKPEDLAYEIIDINGNVRDKGDLDNYTVDSKNRRIIFVDENDMSSYITLNNGETLSLYPKGSKGFFVLANRNVITDYKFVGRHDFIAYFNQITDSGEVNLSTDINEDIWSGNLLFTTREIGYYKINIISASSEPMIFQYLNVRF